MKKGEFAQTLAAERRPSGAWWRVLLTTLLLYIVGVAVLVPTGKIIAVLVGMVFMTTTITGVWLICSILEFLRLKK